MFLSTSSRNMFTQETQLIFSLEQLKYGCILFLDCERDCRFWCDDI